MAAVNETSRTIPLLFGFFGQLRVVRRRGRDVLWFCLDQKPSQQVGEIVRPIERPERLQNLVRSLLWPARADIAAEFSSGLGATHRPTDKSWDVVDLPDNALAVDKNRRDARRNRGRVGARGERRILD